jgi:hypothetical protein
LLTIWVAFNTGLDPQATSVSVGLPNLAAIASEAYFCVLRQWLKDCDTTHSGCHLGNKEPSLIETPTRLIDVGETSSSRVRLLETQRVPLGQLSPVKYIALSHPWGDKVDHNHCCTTRLNLSDHKNRINIDTLPNTLRDAIHVTRKLGARYLWVDSLCIIQGEDGDFDREAKHMETVFSSAYCVIAATCASGMSSGFLKRNTERKSIVKFERAGKLPFYLWESIDNFQGDVVESSLNKRGWVLQERALARRTIYFAENQTYWECGQGVCCETGTRMRKLVISNS